MRLISVIFGAPTIQARATRLVNYWLRAIQTLKPSQYNPGKQVLSSPKVWFGTEDSVKVGLAEAFNVTLPRGQAIN